MLCKSFGNAGLGGTAVVMFLHSRGREPRPLTAHSFPARSLIKPLETLGIQGQFGIHLSRFRERACSCEPPKRPVMLGLLSIHALEHHVLNIPSVYRECALISLILGSLQLLWSRPHGLTAGDGRHLRWHFIPQMICSMYEKRSKGPRTVV